MSVAAGATTETIPALDERRLLLDHRSGKQGAFAELVRSYRVPVYSYLARCGVVADDRDDLFQEIFLRVHRGSGTYQADRPLHPWLFTIVANVVRTYLRRRRIHDLVWTDPQPSVPATTDPATDDADGERTAVARETVSWLEQEIERLPQTRREVLLLACLEGMPLKDVAEVLGMPLSTVKTHLRRTRMALAERLARRNRGEVST